MVSRQRAGQSPHAKNRAMAPTVNGEPVEQRERTLYTAEITATEQPNCRRPPGDWRSGRTIFKSAAQQVRRLVNIVVIA
uniref:Uncharacterized protein n=1 Tax=Plectus sambesii TaxID=2011161 RepID=A0A914X174_9BILA